MKQIKASGYRTTFLAFVMALGIIALLTVKVWADEPAEQQPGEIVTEEIAGSMEEQLSESSAEVIAGGIEEQLSEGAAGIVITKQPENAVVSYPAGAKFTVEVQNPENVQSWQWILRDCVNNEFILDGTSAKTNELIVPSTQQADNTLYYRCVITDKEGNSVVSDEASLDMDNKEEDKTVLYIGNYALEPGQQLDLSTTELGSGIVTFEADGMGIVLDNAIIDNSNNIYDSTVSPSLCMRLDRCNDTQEGYTIHLKGDNQLINTYYQEETNGSGITMDFTFRGSEDNGVRNALGADFEDESLGIRWAGSEDLMVRGTEKAFFLSAAQNGRTLPAVEIENVIYDGTLTISGGTYGIRSTGKISLDTDIIMTPNGDHFMNGIVCNSLEISEDLEVDLKVNGYGLVAYNGLLIKSASNVTIRSTAPKVSEGYTSVGGIFVGRGKMELEADVRLIITGSATPDNDVQIGGYAGIVLENGAELDAYYSRILIAMTAEEDTDPGNLPYASNFFGVYSDGDISLDNTEFLVIVAGPEIYGAYGVHSSGSISMENCNAQIGAQAGGIVAGLVAEKDLTVTKTNMDVITNATGKWSELTDYGAVSYALAGSNLNLTINDPDYHITAETMDENGIAVLANTEESGDTPKGYDPTYESKKIHLSGMGGCLTPENNAISLGSIPGYDESPYIYVETYYDTTDTSKPAGKVGIGVKGINIVTQPSDASVNYPEGTFFEVAVAEPDQVASYQWTMIDAADQEYFLDGTSAKTSRLEIPSTSQNVGSDRRFRCLITMKDGSAGWSREASLTIANTEEAKLVLYVSEYALEPGGTMDLAQYGLGSGTIEFAADGQNVTLNNVDFNNTAAVCDHLIRPSMALTLYGRERTEKEFFVHVKGKNTITNTFYQPSTNMCGIAFNILLFGPQKDQRVEFYPTVTFDGVKGTNPVLIFKGGEAIHSYGDVTIKTRVSTFPVEGGEEHEAGMLHLENATLTITNGAEVDLNTNGTAVFVGGNDSMREAESNLVIEDGAVVNVNCDFVTPLPDDPSGSVSLNAVYVENDIRIKDAVFNLCISPTMTRASSIGFYVDTILGVELDYGTFSVTNGSAEIAFVPLGDEPVNTFAGIACESANEAVRIKKSDLLIFANYEKCKEAFGISASGSISITKKSNVVSNVSAKQYECAIETTEGLVITDSNVTARTNDEHARIQVAIVCGTLEADLSKSSYKILAESNGGYSICALAGIVYDPVYYQKDYKPTHIALKNMTIVSDPAKGEISTWSISAGDDMYRKLETFFDPKDTTKPASTVEIIKKKSIAKAKVTLAKTSVTYTGKEQKPAVKSVVLDGTTLKEGRDYTVSYKHNIKAGTAIATVTGCGIYKDTASAGFTITKAKQPMKVTTAKKTISAAKLAKEKKIVKAIVVKKNQGKVTYEKLSVNKEEYNENFSVNKTTGKITVKKGTPKGTYKIKVRVKAKGNKNYKAGHKNVTVTIIVK